MSLSSRRIIRAQENTASSQWALPQVKNKQQEKQQEIEQEQSAPLITAAQLEAITQEAQEEGYAKGYEEGKQAGHAAGLEVAREEVTPQLESLEKILETLEHPFTELDEQVEQEIVTLVIAMVRQLVRREIKADAGQIVGVVREALGELPVNARRIRVLLHPEDAAVVRAAYQLGEKDQKWQIIEDPVVQRGGCRVYTEFSQIDATLESRLNALIAPLLHTEREGDAADESE